MNFLATIRKFIRIEKNSECLLAKEFEVYNPKYFGHHKIYISGAGDVALIHYKANKTIYIILGDLLSVKRMIVLDSNGVKIDHKSFSPEIFQWKLNKNKIIYRIKISSSVSHENYKTQVKSMNEFHEKINDMWISEKAEEILVKIKNDIK